MFSPKDSASVSVPAVCLTIEPRVHLLDLVAANLLVPEQVHDQGFARAVKEPGQHLRQRGATPSASVLPWCRRYACTRRGVTKFFES